MGLLVRMNEERELTVVLVTHETDISEYAKRVVVFKDGRIESDRLNHAAAAARGTPAREAIRHGRARGSRGEPVSFFGLLRIAVKGFSRHRLRALLTTLGIMIGVGAFIAMVALGRGASERVAAQMAAMGSNVLIVRGGRRLVRRARGAAAGSPSTTTTSRPSARSATPSATPRPRCRATPRWCGAGSTGRPRSAAPPPTTSTSAAWTMQRGAFFGQRDVDTANKVCVLGQVVVDQLFGGEDPAGPDHPRAHHELPGHRRPGPQGAGRHGPGLRRRRAHADHGRAAQAEQRRRRPGPGGRAHLPVGHLRPGHRRGPRARCRTCCGSASAPARGTPTIPWCAT